MTSRRLGGRKPFHWLAAGILVVPMVATAQQGRDAAAKKDDSGGLAEVLVTAERFSSNVQTTPVAVTALTSEILVERQITGVLEASSQVPGIVITPATGSSNSARIVLRGAGQEQGGINFDPAVGIYIDNVYQPRINGAFFDFFDIERLEVLRGPQGTLYGRNTSGGALKIESRKPSYDWKASGEASVGNWDAKQARGFITGPLLKDRIAFSLSGVIRQRDGFIWGDWYGRRLGEMDRRAFRGKLLFNPTDALEIEAAVISQQDFSDPGIGIPLSVGPGVVDPYANGTRRRDLTRTEVFGPIGQALWNNGASINATYNFSDKLSLHATTGYGNLRIHSTGSILWLSAAAQQQNNGLLNIGAGGDGRTHDDFKSQEVNLTWTGEKLKGVAGLFYFKESGEAHAYQGTINDQIRDTKAVAVFAQAAYEFVDGLSVTIGDRWTKEDAEFTQWYKTGTNATTAPQGPYKKSFTGTSPKIGFNWQVTDDWLTYLSLTRGFKSGGWNPVPPSTNVGVPGQIGAPVPYDPEKVDSYELGTKYQTANRRLRLNLAVFQAKYKGLQLPVFFPGTSNSYTSNASTATIKGIEFEPTWQVLDSLQVYSSMSWTQGKYTSPFICSGQFGTFRECSGNRIKGVIPHKLVSGLVFTPKLPIPGQIRVSTEWNRTGAYFNNVANEGFLVQTESSDIYNGAIGWTSPDETLAVTVDVRNLADKHYVLAGLQLANATKPSVSGYINEPRQVVLRVRKDF